MSLYIRSLSEVVAVLCGEKRIEEQSVLIYPYFLSRRSDFLKVKTDTGVVNPGISVDRQRIR